MSETKDIILGMDVAPPSIQQQEMERIANQNAAVSQLQAETLKSTNVHGTQMVVTALSQYEREKFTSKTDWRMRAVSATNMHLRTNHIYVNSDDLKEIGYTYVLPKNILKRFICISDLRIQVAGYMYGVSPPENPQVKEIRAIVLVPQIGSYQNVTLPHQSPEHPYLKDMEPLGWIHTSPTETHQLSPFAAVMHTKLLVENATWDTDASVVATCSFTTGSCSLSVYKLTSQGFEWGKQHQETSVQPNQPDYNGQNFYEKVQMILSDKFLGFFMVPEGGLWNYNFNGQNFSVNMRFNLMLDNPKDFYHESHRAIHFLDFAVRATTNDENTTVDSADGNKQASGSGGAQDSNMPDRDDFFL